MAASLDPHPAPEAFFVGMVEHEARFGIAPAVAAGAVVEVHEPEALHLEPAAHHGLGPLAHHLVEAVLGVLDPPVAGEILHLQVGGLGEAPNLGEQLRRPLVREDRLFRELLGHGGIVAEARAPAAVLTLPEAGPRIPRCLPVPCASRACPSWEALSAARRSRSTSWTRC